MHRGEMPLFIVRYGAAAIGIVTPRGGGSHISVAVATNSRMGPIQW